MSVWGVASLTPSNAWPMFSLSDIGPGSAPATSICSRLTASTA